MTLGNQRTLAEDYQRETGQTYEVSPGSPVDLFEHPELKVGETGGEHEVTGPSTGEGQPKPEYKLPPLEPGRSYQYYNANTRTWHDFDTKDSDYVARVNATTHQIFRTIEGEVPDNSTPGKTDNVQKELDRLKDDAPGARIIDKPEDAPEPAPENQPESYKQAREKAAHTFKPDFTKENPYAGAPKGYREKAAAGKKEPEPEKPPVPYIPFTIKYRGGIEAKKQTEAVTASKQVARQDVDEWTKSQERIKVKLSDFGSDDRGYNLAVALKSGKLSEQDLLDYGFQQKDIDSAKAAVKASKQTGVALAGEGEQNLKQRKAFEQAEKDVDALADKIKKDNPKISTKELNQRLADSPEGKRLTEIGAEIESKGVLDVPMAKRGAVTAASWLFPPAKAGLPEYTMKDVTAMDWASGVANVALIAVPLVGPAATAGMLSVGAARGISGGVQVAATAIFTKDTIDNWDYLKQHPAEMGIAIGMDTIVAFGAARTIAPERVSSVTRKIVSVAKETKPGAAKPGETASQSYREAYGKVITASRKEQPWGKPLMSQIEELKKGTPEGLQKSLDDAAKAMQDADKARLQKAGNDMLTWAKYNPDSAAAEVIDRRARMFVEHPDDFVKLGDKIRETPGKGISTSQELTRGLSAGSNLPKSQPSQVEAEIQQALDRAAQQKWDKFFDSHRIPRNYEYGQGALKETQQEWYERLRSYLEDRFGRKYVEEHLDLSPEEIDQITKEVSRRHLNVNEAVSGNEELFDEIEKHLKESKGKSEEPPPQEPLPEKEGIPTMITRDMEFRLKAKGYSQEDIDRMTPQDAWDILNEKTPESKGGGVAVKEKTETKTRTETKTEVKERTEELTKEEQEKLSKLKERQAAKEAEAKPKVKPETKPKEETKSKEEAKARPSTKPEPKAEPAAKPSEKPATRTATTTKAAPSEKPSERTSPGVSPQPMPGSTSKASPSASPAATPAPQPGPQPQPQPAPKPQPAPTPHPQPQPRPEPRPFPQPLPKPVPALPKARLPINATDEEKREYIKASNGAIGWRMGKLNGKDRYDVIVNPYSSNEDYVMVLGGPPQGATVAGGPRSAYRTAKMLYGQPPKRPVHIDSGIEDITARSQGRDIALTFTPDPKGLTRGDIHIGQRRPRISGRPPRITSPRPRIGR